MVNFKDRHHNQLISYPSLYSDEEGLAIFLFGLVVSEKLKLFFGSHYCFNKKTFLIENCK